MQLKLQLHELKAYGSLHSCARGMWPAARTGTPPCTCSLQQAVKRNMVGLVLQAGFPCSACSACNHPPAGIHGGPVCWLPTQRLTIGVGQMQWCHNNLSLSLSQHPWSGWYQQRPLTSAILTTTWCSAREQQHHSHRSLASLHYTMVDVSYNGSTGPTSTRRSVRDDAQSTVRITNKQRRALSKKGCHRIWHLSMHAIAQRELKDSDNAAGDQANNARSL
jgi:hypothetical protein